MGGLALIAGVALVARIAVGWAGWRLAGLAAVVWTAMLAVLLGASESGAAQMVGMTPRAWAATGVLGAVVLTYRAAVRWAGRHARPIEVRRETDPPPPPPVPAPTDPDGPLRDAELDRYARHIVLREIGGPGQRRLKAARVLVVGAGGLGAPVLLYLAAAGVGRITLADDDRVDLSNLQRQVIFDSADAGRMKAQAAADAAMRLNSHVAVTPLTRRITADDTGLIAAHDLVLDGTDSFSARSAVNAACVAAGVPLIAGAIAQWEGQVTLYDPARGGPCLACLFPEPPAPGQALPCAEAGVVGALPGVVGSLMAIEAIKHLAGVADRGAGQGLRGRMILFDGLWGETRSLTITARAGCHVCGGRGAPADKQASAGARP